MEIVGITQKTQFFNACDQRRAQQCASCKIKISTKKKGLFVQRTAERQCSRRRPGLQIYIYLVHKRRRQIEKLPLYCRPYELELIRLIKSKRSVGHTTG